MPGPTPHPTASRPGAGPETGGGAKPYPTASNAETSGAAKPAAERETGGAKATAAPAGPASARPGGQPDPSSAAKPGAGREGGDGSKPAVAPAGPASARPDSQSDAGGGSKPAAAQPDAGTAVKPAAVSAKTDAQSDPGTDHEPGVDRKTAVFRAVKRPEVDQPTAMLKLPPQAPGELPSERGSTFVPLRGEDQRTPGAQAVAEAERTRQQPMPPLPPLDLLAELTNKPAPPETPARTVVRRVKIWTPLLVLVLIIFAVVQAVRPLPAPTLNLTAKSTYTFEGDKPSLPWPGEGQGYMAATGLGTVGSFGEQKAVPIGSVAKAMTAYVVLKDKPLKRGDEGPSIEVDAKAEEDGGLDAQGESTLNTVKEGDTLTQHDALAAIMIPSANNIARLLARWDANGSEEAFVKKMNDTAEELGMKNTTYTDPSGLDATTVSSAEDQVKLGQKLVEIPALMDITKLPEWTDPSGKSWRNYNTLVPYDGALGIKTGSTTKAGGNLLFAAHKMVGDTDQLIVGAVLGQHEAPIIDTVNAVSKDVMLATQDELEGATIVKKGAVVGEVDNGMGTTTPVVATEDVKAVGWSGLTVKLELTDGGETLPHSAAAGTHVGTLTVGEGRSQVEVAVALQSDVSEPTFTDKLTRVS
nr:D-alanyl-D-alanine carboxypeptidase [Streptomyces sp. NBC_01716]